MIKKITAILALAVLSFFPVAASANTVCTPDRIEHGSLVELFQKGDLKAGVTTDLITYDKDDTNLIFDFVEKKTGTSLERHEHIMIASREGFPTVLVFFVDNGCVQFAGQMNREKEYNPIVDMLNGV